MNSWKLSKLIIIKRTLQTCLMVCSSIAVAFAVECMWQNFQEFRNAVNRAAFEHGKYAYEQKHGPGSWNDSKIDSDGNGTADPLEGKYYCLGDDGYACSEFSAYVHNLMLQPVETGGLGVPRGEVQTVWDSRHSVIRLKEGLICDGRGDLVDGWRYVEPQGMQYRKTVYGRLQRVFDDPNPIRKGIFKENWAYDGPESSTGYVSGEDVGGGGLFGGGNGFGSGFLSMLVSSLMGLNQDKKNEEKTIIDQLYESFQPTPSPTPTITPTPSATPTPSPTPELASDTATPEVSSIPTEVQTPQGGDGVQTPVVQITAVPVTTSAYTF